jgi:hypothetical protein
MKNNRFSHAFMAIIATFLTFAACQKSGTTVTTDSAADIALLKGFMDKNAPKTESFTMSAAQSFTLTTTKGTKIFFPANTLLNANGQIATGNVVISVKEAQNAADMLLSDKPTLTNDGKMLISLGVIKIDAVQNGVALKLRDTVPLNVNMVIVPNPAIVNREIPMWNGDTTVTTVTSGLNSEGVKTTVTSTVPAMKGINWTQMNGFGVPNNATSQVNFVVDKLGQWRNCDALYNDTRTKTTVLGYFSSNYNAATTATYQGFAPSSLFFKAKGQNTLVKFYNLIVTPTAGKEGFYSYENSIPIGLEGTFLAMSVIDGKYFVDMKDAIIAAPASGKTFSSISFSPVEVTEADLLAKITLLKSK